MSQIAKELQYISAWLEYLNPDFVDCYNRGLSREKINEIVKNLPFKLSDEVYELYQWGNGVANDSPIDFLFPDQLLDNPIIKFISLQHSVTNYHNLYQLSQKTIDPSFNYEFWKQQWFPIASFENKRILYVIGNLDPSPVYLYSVGCINNPVRIYKNLTSMISVIAECCEFDLYQIVPGKYGDEDDLRIRIDKEKLELEKAIYQKYNL